MTEVAATYLAGFGSGAIMSALLLWSLWDWREDAHEDDPNESGVRPL